MLRFLLPLALLGNGLAAGGLMIAVLGGAPLQFALPTERYVQVHQFLTTRFDPFMPVCMTVALVTDLVAAFVATFVAASPVIGALFFIAAALLIGALVVSVLGNAPINRWVAGLDPQALPDNWAEVDPRVRWRNWNAVRTSCAVAAFVINVSVVAALMRP